LVVSLANRHSTRSNHDADVGEVQVEARVGDQPTLHRGGLVREELSNTTVEAAARGLARIV
jgi:hypothetical protein